MNENIETGARNLLLNCANAKAGDRILLVGEHDDSPYFDPQLCDDVAGVAESLGASAKIIMAKTVTDASQFPGAVRDAMQTADVTIFFSRLGDQVRFAETPGNSRKIMTYTLTRKHLQSPFAGIDYQAMKKIHDRLVADIKASSSYRIETSSGTALSAPLQHTLGSGDSDIAEFTVELFPVMIFPPVICSALKGRLVIEDFVMSTSVRQFADSVFYMNSPVTATVEDSRMVHFDGDAGVIEGLRAQLERAAAITGGDPYRLNSWHTGINPYTFFDGNPHDYLERWGTVSYGSPRYTHLHTAGNDPGDASFHLMDASILFDDIAFWDRGKFVYLDRPEIQALLDPQERQLLNSSVVGDIGI
jgi:hypothetical protein